MFLTMQSFFMLLAAHFAPQAGDPRSKVNLLEVGGIIPENRTISRIILHEPAFIAFTPTFMGHRVVAKTFACRGQF
jgi:hypothetical protein